MTAITVIIGDKIGPIWPLHSQCSNSVLKLKHLYADIGQNNEKGIITKTHCAKRRNVKLSQFNHTSFNTRLFFCSK